MDLEKRKRFLTQIKRVKSGCHEWLGTIYKNGYGAFWYENHQQLAHRAAWNLLKNESIPAGKCVLHRCDNRSCVNPEHLYIGTRADNNRDTMERSPRRTPFAQVQKARELVASGVSQRKVAAEIGVSQAQISKYVRFKDRVLR